MKITAPIHITAHALQQEGTLPVELLKAEPAVYANAVRTLQAGGTGWTVWQDGVFCGILTLMPAETERDTITVLYVLPAYRGLGLAYVLLEQAAVRPMEIWLSLRQETAQRLLTRFGFAYSGESLPGEREPLVQYIYTPSALPEVRLDVPYIDQREKYPTGCESVSTVMALRYAGLDMSVETWIDCHLPKGKTPGMEAGVYTGADPWKVFPGDPYSPDD